MIGNLYLIRGDYTIRIYDKDINQTNCKMEKGDSFIVIGRIERYDGHVFTKVLCSQGICGFIDGGWFNKLPLGTCAVELIGEGNCDAHL